VKLEAAKGEEAWNGCGQKPGVEIWRIEKFKVKHWPKDQYGTFYDGDSYIVLNTYKVPDVEKLLYNVHFWLGKDTSQDEQGTAAYKTGTYLPLPSLSLRLVCSLVRHVFCLFFYFVM
jgi:gelsolin